MSNNVTTVKIPLMDFIDLIETSVRFELLEKQFLDAMAEVENKPFFFNSDVVRILNGFFGNAMDEKLRGLINQKELTK